MGRRLKSCATAFDGRCPPQQFVWGNRRIVQNDTVAAGNQMTRSRTRGLLHYAVSKESAVARIEHDFTCGDFLKIRALDGEQVTRLDCGSHAGPSDAQAPASKCADCFGNKIASESI